MSSTISLCETEVSRREMDPERQRVRQDVLDLASKYQSEDEEPPFDAKELLVMACLTDAVLEGLGKMGIAMRILELFPYYRRQAMEHYAWMQHFEESTDHETIHPGMNDALNAYEVPILPCGGECGAVTERFYGLMDVPARAGRLYLSKWLDPGTRKGSFPLLKLPAELRNTIYEMVFTFPAEGILLEGSSVGHGPGLEVTRRPEQPESVRGFNHYIKTQCEAQACDLPEEWINMDFLLVNRQIYSEAVPLFYQLNRFYCQRLGDSCNLLNALPRARAQHLSDIHIALGVTGVCDAAYVSRFPPAMAKLAVAKRLRRLEIEVDMDDWLDLRPSTRNALGRTVKATHHSQLLEFRDLAIACSKADVLIFKGKACQGIEQWIREQVSKVKEAAEKGIEYNFPGKTARGKAGVVKSGQRAISKKKAKKA